MTRFYVPINNASSRLASGRAQGSGSAQVRAGDGALFGTPTPSAPIRVTFQSAAGLVTIFECTGRTGDTLAGLVAIEGTTDRAFASGDVVACRPTAGALTDLHSAVTDLATAQGLTSASVEALDDALDALDAALADYARDSDVVHKAGDETIGGSKTFTSPVTAGTVVGGAASGGHLALSSTSHATKGTIDLGSRSTYNEYDDFLGIGTTTPQHKVHVVDATANSGETILARLSGANSYNGLAINSAAGKQANIQLQQSGVQKWAFGVDFAAAGVADFYLYDATAGRNPLYIKPDGEVRIGGTSGYAGSQAVTIGSSSARLRVNNDSPGTAGLVVRLATSQAVPGFAMEDSNGVSRLAFGVDGDRPVITFGDTSSDYGLSIRDQGGNELARIQDNGAMVAKRFQAMETVGTVGQSQLYDYGIRRGDGDGFVQFDSAGNPAVRIGGAYGAAYTATARIESAKVDAPVLVVRGAESQSGDLFQAENFDGTIVVRIAGNGEFMPLYGVRSNNIADNLNANVLRMAADSTHAIVAQSYSGPGVVPFSVRGATSQTAPLFEAEDSNGVAKFWVTPDGGIVQSDGIRHGVRLGFGATLGAESGIAIGDSAAADHGSFALGLQADATSNYRSCAVGADSKTTRNGQFVWNGREQAILDSLAVRSTIQGKTWAPGGIEGPVRDMAEAKTSWIDTADATRKARVDYLAMDAAGERIGLSVIADGATGWAALAAPASTPSDAHLLNGQVVPYTDASGTNLYFRHRKPDGSYATFGPIPAL